MRIKADGQNDQSVDAISHQPLTPNSLVINPINSIYGAIEMPGDKSISHRALIFGSLCEGLVEITNFLAANDCLSTLQCLLRLGVRIKQSGANVTIEGVGKYGFKAPKESLDVGNSGTTLRILPGLLAAQNFESTLIGDVSVSKRPMYRIIEPLSYMGAKIKSTEGHAPIKIIGTELSAINYQLPVASAQVKSAILLAGLFADGTTRVSEEIKSRDHTEIMLKYLGADLKVSEPCHCEELCNVTISGSSKLKAKPIYIPGDISSAAFFIAAALVLKNSKITIKNCGINRSRLGFLKILKNAGVNIRILNKPGEGEPVADIVAESSNLKPFKIIACDIPSLVDEIPILAVLATQINGTSVISGAEELRVKESDRLQAISSQLRIMGADIEEKKDGLVIKGPTRLKGATVDSKGDHRIAMSLAIAGLVAEGKTLIKGSECIDISFPNFKKLLDKVAG